MPVLDLAIIACYLAGTVAVGARFSRSHRNVRDYFVGARAVPWWAVLGSIVATETSTVTFISVPGYAYGADFTFLQLVFGYLIGRVAVSVLFVPAYFRGELLTVYQLLGERFGGRLKRLASAIFLVTRNLSDGFRLFATGLVLAALLVAIPGVGAVTRAAALGHDPATTALVISILLVGTATIVYTFLGGMSAVIWTDVVQLIVYVTGALVAAVILLEAIPGGWNEVAAVATAGHKFRLLDFTLGLSKGYTFWSGVIGGAFLTTATHGTDQLMVQRYLCARSPREARLAIIGSGVAVLAQFVLFLLIGTMLYVYYTGHAPTELAALTVDGHVQTDRLFPAFIVTHLPQGITGLVVAAVFAAAMSTLSSSLNSSSAAVVADFYLPWRRGTRPATHDLSLSRWITVGWGVVQVGVALAAISLSRRVVDEVLGIASFTSGLILGMFLLGTLTTRVDERSAFAGVMTGTVIMLGVKLATTVNWQWYVLLGSMTTVLAGLAAGALRHRSPSREST